jgi:peptidoglycan/xylan/chitin deacetylase (PgdA/CDA1 family)
MQRPKRAWQVLVLIYAVTALAAGGANAYELIAQVEQSRPVASTQAIPSPTTPDVPAPAGQSAALGPVLAEVIPLGRKAIRLPIVEYHYIRVVTNPYDRLGWNLSVTPQNFKAQLDWLAAHDYHPVTFDDVRAYFQGRKVLPARPVVLTFDDGYQNFWDVARPMLADHQFKAVAYIVPGFWGQAWYMTAAEVLELDRSGLVEIASHTMNHANLADSSPGTRVYQLDVSRGTLEHLLGHQVLDFCYPSGDFNGAAVAAVGSAGYITATTQVPGTTLAWSARLVWPRVRAAGGETLPAYVTGLGQPEPTVTVLMPPAPVPTPRPGYF